MATARQQVASALRPLLPKTWKLRDYMTDFDKLSSPTVMLHVTEVGPFPQAPLGHLLVTMEATILCPNSDPSRAWGVLDDQVLELIHDLGTIDALTFSTAEPIVYSNHFGFNVRFTVPSTKD